MADFWTDFFTSPDEELAGLQAKLAKTYRWPANKVTRKARDKATAALMAYARSKGLVGAVDLTAGLD